MNKPTFVILSQLESNSDLPGKNQGSMGLYLQVRAISFRYTNTDRRKFGGETNLLLTCSYLPLETSAPSPGTTCKLINEWYQPPGATENGRSQCPTSQGHKHGIKFLLAPRLGWTATGEKFDAGNWTQNLTLAMSLEI